MEQSPSNSARRRRVQAAHREVTRSLLLDAAVRVFAERGYADATVDEIATEAGTSRATFYLHFHAKSELLRSLLERAQYAFDERYDQLVQSLRSLDEAAVREWISLAMGRWNEIEDLMRPVHEAAFADARLFHEVFPDDLPGLSDMSDALISAGVVRDDAEASMCAVILHAPLFYLFRKHLRGEPFDQVLAAELLAGAWIDVAAGTLGATRDSG